MSDQSFVSGIFQPFNQTGIQAASQPLPGGVIETGGATVDAYGNIIDPSNASQYAAVIDPLTGQVTNQPIPPGYHPQSSLSQWFSDFEKQAGAVGTFALVALGLVTAIVVIPRILPKR